MKNIPNCEIGKLSLILKILAIGTDKSGTSAGPSPVSFEEFDIRIVEVARMSIASTIIGVSQAAAPTVSSTGNARNTQTAGIPNDLNPLLAQIPDLDQKTTATPKSRSMNFDGRILSQAMSMKMVFGLGIGLVIGAVMPYLFGRGSTPAKPVTELPAWTAAGADSNAASTAQTQAPLFQPPQPTVVMPQIEHIGISQQPPRGAEYQPAAPARHDWSPPRDTAAAPSIGPTVPANKDGGAPSNVVIDRRDDRYDRDAAERSKWQADNRNDVAAPYRSEPGYDYRGNAIEPSVRRDVPPVGPATADRYNGYNGPTLPAGARPESPLMPSAYDGPAGNRGVPQNTDAGVARFEGTIATPPATTNYERSRSSNY